MSSRNIMLKTYKEGLHNFLCTKEKQHKSRSIDLLQRSKQLILNNEKYNKYSTFYGKLTTFHTFKLPNVLTYPIQHNEEIIPLKNRIKLEKSPKTELIYLSPEKHKEKDENNNKKKFSGVNINFNDHLDMNANTFIKYIDKFNNKNSVIYQYIMYKEKYFINKKNDDNIEILKRLISCDSDFGHKNKIDNNFFIEECQTEIRMKYESMKVYFYEEEKKINTIKFDFNFLVFFYAIEFFDFKNFLSYCIFYDEKEKKFKLNLENYHALIKRYKTEKYLFSYRSFMFASKYDDFTNEYNYILENKKRFNLKIKLPRMSFTIKKGKIKKKIFKQVDIAHNAYFIDTNFQDWDFYMLNSFCVFRRFRDIVNSSLSMKQSEDDSNLVLCLDKKEIGLTPFHQDQTTFEFFYQKDLNTSFFCLNSSSIKVIIKEPEGHRINEYVSNFSLNLKQAIQLNKFDRYVSIEGIIQKCLKIKKKKNSVESIKLDINESIFNFDESLLKMFKKPQTIPKEKNLVVQYNTPYILWFTYDGVRFQKKKYQLTKEQANEVLQSPIKVWGHVISSLSEYFIDQLSEEERESNRHKTGEPIRLRRKLSSRTKLKYKTQL